MYAIISRGGEDTQLWQRAEAGARRGGGGGEVDAQDVGAMTRSSRDMDIPGIMCVCVDTGRLVVGRGRFTQAELGQTRQLVRLSKLAKATLSTRKKTGGGRQVRRQRRVDMRKSKDDDDDTRLGGKGKWTDRQMGLGKKVRERLVQGNLPGIVILHQSTKASESTGTWRSRGRWRAEQVPGACDAAKAVLAGSNQKKKPEGLNFSVAFCLVLF